jgi:hypothetical protein
MEDFPPRAEITEFVLTGEPVSDKGFVATATGNKYRARVTPRGAYADEDGRGVPRAPTHFVLEITVSALDDKDNVEKIGDGYVISERHELTIGPDQRGNPNYSVENSLLDLIRIAIAQLEIGRQTQASMQETLSSWGVSFDLPMTPPPSSEPA